MPQRSAGILLFRRRGAHREVFLVHPGGPFWAKKDEGAWTLPKGLVGEDEEPLLAAKREFHEETGFEIDGAVIDLGTFRQPSGKILRIWAAEGDCDPAKLVSNSFDMVWPPKSGKSTRFPEVDRGAWFGEEEARTKILRGQLPVLEAFFTRMGDAGHTK